MIDLFTVGKGSNRTTVRYSLEELMTSEESDLSQFKGRIQTKTEFYCYPNNFLVLEDQRTVLGIDKKKTKFGVFSSKGMVGLKYSLLQKNKYILVQAGG